MTIKTRNTVIASSLGSYFGVGFNDPLTQLEMDLGEREVVFDKDSEWRMEIGRLMEDASLNVIEKALDIRIINRNISVVETLDGKLRCKFDGETFYNGEETVVENKYSNAKSGVFTEDKGYHFQCQAYMLATGYKQALLCGMYQGAPVWKLIKRDEDMIADITEMVQAVYEILNGFKGKEDFPYHLVEKYNPSLLVVSDEFDEADTFILDKVIELTSEIDGLTTMKNGLTDYLKDKYTALKASTDTCNISVFETVRKGSINMNNLQNDYPDIDFEKYRDEPSTSKTVRVTKRKVA
jgi:predicted phage-related endonuclease